MLAEALLARLHGLSQPAKRQKSDAANDGLSIVTSLDALDLANGVAAASAKLSTLLQLVVAIASAPPGEWAQQDSNVGPVEAAGRLLDMIMPTGSKIPLPTTLQLLDSFGKLPPNFLSRALRWIVLAHEVQDCWDNLIPAYQVLLFHVRKHNALVRDGCFALLRLCQAQNGSGNALLTPFEIGRTVRQLVRLDRIREEYLECNEKVRQIDAPSAPPASLRALVCHQVERSADGVSLRLSLDIPFHSVPGALEYNHNERFANLEATACRQTLDEPTAKAWMERLSLLQPKRSTQPPTSRGLVQPASAATGSNRPSTPSVGLRDLLDATMCITIASPRAACSSAVTRATCRALRGHAATSSLLARENAQFWIGIKAAPDAGTRRLVLLDAARLAISAGITSDGAMEWIGSSNGWQGLSNAEQYANLRCARTLVEHMRMPLPGTSQQAAQLSLAAPAPVSPHGPCGPALAALGAVANTVLNGSKSPTLARFSEGVLDDEKQVAENCVLFVRSAHELLRRNMQAYKSAGELARADAVIRCLVSRVDELCQRLLERATIGRRVLFGRIIALFETVATLHNRHGAEFIVLPSVTLMQRCLLEPCPLVVSRLCGLLAAYRFEIEALKANPVAALAMSTTKVPTNGLADIPRYNAIVFDTCNALWRNKAFQEVSTADAGPTVSVQPNTSCLHLPKHALDALAAALFEANATQSSLPSSMMRKPVTPDPVRALRRTFSITYGPSWQPFIKGFLEESVDVGERATLLMTETGRCGLRTAALLEEPAVKTAYLDYLREQGMVGLHDFLYAFISSLAKKRDALIRAGQARP